jgi:antitoxin Phd
MSQLENCTKLLAMLYNRGMAKITVSEARERLSEVVETSRTEAVVFERYGQPAAILISPDRYEKMMEALEEVQDIAAFDEAMSEEGGNIPWEQVKADLGWS